MVTAGFAVTLVPVVDDNPVAGDHVYVEAPVAVNVVLDPIHIAAGGTVIIPLAFTVTIAVVVETQPAALVPVIVYVVVAAGVALTLVPVVALKPVDGDHV